MSDRLCKSALLAYAFVHLALVTLSAVYIKIPQWLPGKNIINLYQRASGADSSYGFFAPSIGKKNRVVFDVVEPSGTKVSGLTLVPDSEREAQIRLGGIYDEFSSKKAEDENFRRTLAASLVAAIFSKHDEAAEVVIRVQEFRPTTMSEHQEGQRAKWWDSYTARFAKADLTPNLFDSNEVCPAAAMRCSIARESDAAGYLSSSRLASQVPRDEHTPSESNRFGISGVAQQ